MRESHNARVILIGNLRRAWQRHDQKLAGRAYRNHGAESRLEGLDDQIETGEIGRAVFGVPGGVGDSTKPLREEDALEHEHPPGEPA